mmetsp:Transcript_13580/g.21751  ORF Transcript_13580/g.21751 Transcript_13580/m.21751 type:complete len:173 (+) Transcript_13580:61-579(+)|eukprot:CAMPEP_0169298344 /NCGR_PEP_ID=MMETSP1016-20121227/66412_1 /TAXON_ID=342587 /ORGANISM="Karlodinium micrum, Strain CCMP2283" /LENGTH=172 /DNA_ID=CAMNT_0009390373 /DNA_START=37 /DNA_END=552 /DNA_ORIENTATION=-
MTTSALLFERLPACCVDAAFAIEEASYPADEAATHEKLQYRQKEAGEYFYGMYLNGSASPENLVGFVCGTLALGELTEDSMSIHEKSGETLCIHSVVVHESQRRKGLATSMMTKYVEEVKTLKSSSSTTANKIALICKENLVKFYSSCGFTLIGPSEVCHGKDPWFDMSMTL